MALPLKPHTADLIAIGDIGADDTLIAHDWEAGTASAAGHLVKLTAVEAFQQFGVETDFPAKWLQDPGALTITKGDRLSIGSDVYTVLTDKVEHDATGMLDYEVYALQKVN